MGERIVCTGCPLLCDDILMIRDKYYGICAHGIRRISLHQSQYRLKHKIHGRVVDVDKVLNKAGEIIRSSKNILIYGMNTSSNEGIRAWISLAQKLRAMIAVEPYIAPLVMWCNKVGGREFLRPLTYVREYSDLVFFVHANPADMALRLSSKYAVYPRGEKVPEGRENRIIIALDNRFTDIMKVANYKLAVSDTLEVLDKLIKSIEENKTLPPSSIPVSRFSLLLSDILKSENPTIIFSVSRTMDPVKVAVRLVKLASLLRNKGLTPTIIPISGITNEAGIASELVKYINDPKYVAYDFAEETVISLSKAISRSDTIVVVRSDAFMHLPLNMINELLSKNIVLIDERETLTSQKAVVTISSTIYGVESKGTMTRCDGEKSKIMKIYEPLSNALTDEEVVKELY